MEKLKISKEAYDIYYAMETRIAELWEKLITGNYNHATQYAYEIGFLCDIDNELKKLKIKRTFVKQKNGKVR